MKRFVMILSVICCCQAAKSQLSNTSWTGSINAGGSTFNVTWHLASDSSYMYNNEDKSLLDVSLYKVQDSTLTIKKVSGLSGCNEAEGLYNFNIKGNELKISLYKDDCYDRYDAMDKTTFTKKEN